MTYQMTPARRAALRKAQLISAQKRRRHTATRAVLHTTRQRAEIAYREGQLKHYQTHEHRQVLGNQTKALPKKAAKAGTKYAAKKALKATAKAGLTIGAATAIGYTAYGMTPHAVSARQNRAASAHLRSMGYGSGTRHVTSSRIAGSGVHGKSIKALPMGPKGRKTVRQRAYRARKR